MESPNYLSRHLLLDVETQERKLKDLDFNFIELPKFNKTEQELVTLMDKWVYFIKNAENLTVIPENIDNNGLKSAYTEADRHAWGKEDLAAYQYAMMRETDEKAEKMLVEEKKAKMITKKLIKRNLINEEIAEDTGLNIKQIEQLRPKKHKNTPNATSNTPIIPLCQTIFVVK